MIWSVIHWEEKLFLESGVFSNNSPAEIVVGILEIETLCFLFSQKEQQPTVPNAKRMNFVSMT